MGDCLNGTSRKYPFPSHGRSLGILRAGGISLHVKISKLSDASNRIQVSKGINRAFFGIVALKSCQNTILTQFYTHVLKVSGESEMSLLLFFYFNINAF